MLMSRRESVLSTVVQTIGVELQEAKNRARRDGKRSVMTLSITAWQQHSKDICDMLDGGMLFLEMGSHCAVLCDRLQMQCDWVVLH